MEKREEGCEERLREGHKEEKTGRRVEAAGTMLDDVKDHQTIITKLISKYGLTIKINVQKYALYIDPHKA